MNDFHNIPAELRDRPQWVGWRMEVRNGKPTKVPVNPATGGYARNNDSATWGTFAEAVNCATARNLAGIGFVFTKSDPYTGIDFDHIINPDSGETDPEALAEIEAFGSYAELSQSETGVHIIVRAKLPGRGRKHGGRECYDSGRFFVFTGRRINPHDIEERQDVLNEWMVKTFPPESCGDEKPAPSAVAPRQPLNRSDAEIVEQISRNHRQGARFAALWRGDTGAYGGDDSAADLALCNFLGWWLDYDHAAVNRLFRQSGLRRDKWDEKRGDTTYGGMTVAKACDGKAGTGYRPGPTVRIPTGTGDATDGGPRKGAQIILDHFRESYRPLFHSGGDAVHCESGEEVNRVVACSGASSRLLAALASAIDSPKLKNSTAVDENALPGFFKKWCATAWKDLVESLPCEDDADLGADSEPAETFRRLVREALLTEITLGENEKDGRREHRVLLPAERLAVIQWCKRFAKKGGRWESVRSKLVYCRASGEAPNLQLHVAIHHGLFSQLIGTDRRIRSLSTDRFNRRCERYGVGSVMRTERVGGQRMVVLSDDFVNELVGMVSCEAINSTSEVDRVSV